MADMRLADALVNFNFKFNILFSLCFYHRHSDSMASWADFSCLCVCVCSFVNTITVEPFEISL